MEDSAEDNDASMSLSDMCDSIVATHHEYLKRELPRLTQLVDKVVRVHGDQHAVSASVETGSGRNAGVMNVSRNLISSGSRQDFRRAL